MRRREFIYVLAGAVAWPLPAHAQQPERVRRVGVLLLWPENDPMARASMTAFTQALARLGWTEGNNIRIDYRFAAGDPTLFKSYAAELVRLMPDVLLAGASLAIVALRQ
jgi:putative ABC transport system substrate-binding protein